MFKEESFNILYKTLKRIFSLPITRSTFRELQKALLTFTEGDTEQANALLNSLLVGEIQGDALKNADENLKNLVEEFSISSLVAKDIFERGEFIALVTSDIITQQNKLLYLNRLRRIDGEEYQFITDVESMINLINHFTGRIQELEKNEQTKKIVDTYRNQLITIRSKIEQMVGTPSAS